jgi:O-antigen ligase
MLYLIFALGIVAILSIVMGLCVLFLRAFYPPHKPHDPIWDNIILICSRFCLGGISVCALIAITGLFVSIIS